MTAQLVVDSNILLLHAFSLYDAGRLLEHVWPSTLEWQESERICRWLARVLGSFQLITTPYALLEFKHVAGSRAKLGQDERERFFDSYGLYLLALQEEHVAIEDILTYERDRQAWWLCFADTSLVLTALRRQAPLFTLDWPAYNFIVRQGGSARHVVEWFYGG